MPTTWEAVISEMRVHKDEEGVQAVHKPLLILMILAQAQRSEENKFRFQEMVEPLERALRDFGPPRKRIHPEYPFWHLQTEEFWVLEDRDKFPVSPGASGPTKKALIDNDAVGHVLPSMWEQLRDDPALVQSLASAILTDGEVQSVMLRMPFEKLERRRFVRHDRDLAYVRFDPIL
jgi:putative restriction endonuclease